MCASSGRLPLNPVKSSRVTRRQSIRDTHLHTLTHTSSQRSACPSAAESEEHFSFSGTWTHTGRHMDMDLGLDHRQRLLRPSLAEADDGNDDCCDDVCDRVTGSRKHVPPVVPSSGAKHY